MVHTEKAMKKLWLWILMILGGIAYGARLVLRREKVRDIRASADKSRRRVRHAAKKGDTAWLRKDILRRLKEKK